MFHPKLGPQSRDAHLVLDALSQYNILVEIAPDGTILHANAHFLSLTSHAVEDILKTPYWALLAETDEEDKGFKAHWSDLKAGHGWSGIVHHIAQQGKSLWLQASYVPVCDTTGKVRKIAMLAMDISAQKAQEESGAQIVAALDRSQAVIEFDPDGTIRTANANFLQAVGYDLENIQGKHHRIFVFEEEAKGEAYAQLWTDLRAGHFRSGEFRRRRSNGTELWIQATYTPILGPDGTPVKVVKFASDITEQKTQTADYESQIAALNRSQAVIEFDLDGTIRTANENFLNAVGYRLEEIQGQHHRIFCSDAIKNSPDYLDHWHALGRGEFRSGEYERITKDGQALWIQATYNPIFNATGKPVKIIKFATDISAQVKRRNEIIQIGYDVDRSLNDIVTAVDEANQKAAEAEQASSRTSMMVQAVASAAEESAASSNEIAQSVANTRDAVGRATGETKAADDATQALAQAAEAMNGIVDIIQTIAGQINLLALNATIESARAGEAGHGFAVVANEVKNLANQVAQATSQISSEITNIQSVSDTVVERLQSIRKEVNAVQDSVVGVASAIEEQSAAAREITDNMHKASGAVSEISTNLTEISQAVALSNSHAQTGMDLSRQLQK